MDMADALQLEQLAFHHHLGEPDEQVENLEITLAQGDLERLHVQPVAGQHAGMIAPFDIGRGTAAAGFGGIDHVVVHQGGGVDHLYDRAEMDRRGRRAAAGEFRRKQQQRGPQPLAAARLQVLPNGGDGVHGRHRIRGDAAFRPAPGRPG